MDPIVNIRIPESGMSIQMIEKEIAAQIRKHEAQLKHWRAVKAAALKLRSGARTVRTGIEQAARSGKRTRTVKKATPAVKAVPRAAAADRTPAKRKAAKHLTLGELARGGTK